MVKENGQDIPGGVLAVVATPIGNLQDLSPRARGVLESSQTLLCEDTRRVAQLLNALGIRKPMSQLERLDAHTPASKFGGWIARLQAGETFALVTDAGTPAVSDPGASFVAAARAEGIPVTPLPGASAPLALLACSGLDTTSFTFRGFFPRKASEQKEELERVAASGLGGAYVWFESPQRVNEALAALAEVAPDVSCAAGKELTKLYERVFTGLAKEVQEQVQAEIEREGTIGEWCFAAVFPARDASSGQSSEWVKALQCMLDAGVSASEAARRVSQGFGTAKKMVYDEALKISGKKNREGD